MSQKINVILFTINDHIKRTSLALPYLKCYAQTDFRIKELINFKILNFDKIIPLTDILLYLINDKPEIIGASTYIWNLNKILAVLKSVKEFNQNIKVILGGPAVSYVPEEIMNTNKFIDIIVRGEGEVTFKELLESIFFQSRDFKLIDSITYQEKGSIISTKNREPIEDLNEIPSPILTGIFDNEEVLEIETSMLSDMYNQPPPTF